MGSMGGMMATGCRRARSEVCAIGQTLATTMAAGNVNLIPPPQLLDKVSEIEPSGDEVKKYFFPKPSTVI